MAEPLPEPRVSIIIPVLNEADRIAECLDRLFRFSWVRDQSEIIVCDGGSVDATAKIAGRYACRFLDCPRGRASQMNQGAAEARGNYLLFLHADSHLPDTFDGLVSLSGDWGFFRLRLDGQSFAYRIIESAINLRTSITRVGGGDQGLFFKRDFFDGISGYPSISLMEDIAICKRARRHSHPQVVQTPLLSSSRRWQQNGVVKTILLMWLLRFAYWFGVDPRRLHRIYYPQQR